MRMYRAGAQVVITRLSHLDPCWQFAGAHVFGIDPDGMVVGGLVVELSRDAIPNDNGSFMIDGVQVVDNERFGNFIGAIEVDPPSGGDALDDFLHQILGEANRPPADDPLGSRERRHSMAGDPVCFTHAFIRPQLRFAEGSACHSGGVSLKLVI